MYFKEKVVQLRKDASMTQEFFAQEVGVSRQAVYKWESGQSYPEVQKLLEMKTLFSISIDNLLDDSYDVPRPEKKKRKRAAAPKAEPVVAEAPKATVAAASAPKAAPVEEAPKATVEAPKIQENESFKVVINNEPVVEAKEEVQEDKKPGSFFGRFFTKK